MPNRYWPGYSSGTSACVLVGFVEPFAWPAKASQAAASAYVVETDGCYYAFRPLQIDAALPPAVRDRIGAQPLASRPPSNCEWDPMRRGYFDKSTGAPHIPGVRSVASRDVGRTANAVAMAARRSDTYDLGRSECSWLIPNGDIDRWRWLPDSSFAFRPCAPPATGSATRACCRSCMPWTASGTGSRFATDACTLC